MLLPLFSLFVRSSTVFSPFDFIPFPLCCLIRLCECVPAHPNPSQGRRAGGRSCRPRPLHVADWYTCFPITHQRTWRESWLPATTLADYSVSLEKKFNLIFSKASFILFPVCTTGSGVLLPRLLTYLDIACVRFRA